MSRHLWRVAFLVVLLASAGLTGCGKPGPKAYPVSGTVTLDGQPLAEGLIYFKTVETGSIDTLNIKDGQFQGQAKDGERRVEISSLRTKVQEFDGMKSEVKEDLVPKQYNRESKLTARVATDGPNQFKFDLTTK